MRKVVVTSLVVLWFSGRSLLAFDFITSRGNGLGQTVVLSDPAASTVLTVPSAALTDGQARFELGINRKFELKDLDQGYFSAAYRKGFVTGAAGLTQFGYGNLYAEKSMRLAGAFNYDAVSLGVSLSLMQVDFGNHYDDLTGGAVGLGVSYRSDIACVALTAENLNSPRLDDQSPPIRTRYTFYTELIGPGPYSVTGRVTLQAEEKPQFGVGQIIGIRPRNYVFWGLATAPLTYGGGLELSYKNSLITYSASYHPTLGFSHTLSVGFIIGKAGVKADGKSHPKGH